MLSLFRGRELLDQVADGLAARFAGTKNPDHSGCGALASQRPQRANGPQPPIEIG